MKKLMVIFTFCLIPCYGIIGQELEKIQLDCSQINEVFDISVNSGLSAEDYFKKGICDLRNNLFEAATSNLTKAKSLGYSNTILLDKALDICNEATVELKMESKSAPEQKKEITTLISHNYEYSLQRNLFNITFSIIALIGLLTSIYLFYYHKKGKGMIYLALLVTGISLALFELVLHWQNNFIYNPIVSFYRVLFFIWAPSLYFYLKSKFIENSISKKELIAHYGIFLLVVASHFIYVNIISFTNPENIGLKVLDLLINDNSFKALQLTIYLGLLVKLYILNKNLFSKNFKKWFKTVFTFMFILTLFLIARVQYQDDFSFDFTSKYFIAIYLSLSILVLDTLLVIQPKLINNFIQLKKIEEEKYKNSGLTEKMKSQLKTDLLYLLDTEKVYLDNSLTLSKLANKLNVDRYSISQVINQEFKKSFYELINDYRIKETLEIISDKQESIILVVDLIYESGFNNKVSFYKEFKKRTKMTPLQFIKTNYQHTAIA